MSGVDHILTLTRQYAIGVSRPGPVWKFTCGVNGRFLPILSLNWRYMLRCVGNLNNQG